MLHNKDVIFNSDVLKSTGAVGNEFYSSDNASGIKKSWVLPTKWWFDGYNVSPPEPKLRVWVFLIKICLFQEEFLFYTKKKTDWNTTSDKRYVN